MTTFNLKEIEKKAYRSTFQDGIWDIFLGLLLLNLAFGALLANSGVSEGLTMTILTALAVLNLLAFMTGKKRITVPRMGFVKFGPKRKRKLWKSRLILLGSVLAGLIVFLAALLIRSYSTERPYIVFLLPAAWVANAIIVFSLLAYYLYYLDCTRLYAYGLLFALPIPCDIVLKKLLGVNLITITFAVSAAVMLLVGTILLYRFLRDYPLPPQEVINGNQ
jgi:hypothetical protein